MTIELSAAQLRVAGRLLRWGGVVVYGIWTVVGFLLLCARQVPSEPIWEAARPLPAGWRLHADDLRSGTRAGPGDRALPPPADFAGKYLRRDRWPGERIGPDDVTTRPLVSVPAGKLALAFPLQDQADLVDVLNAGSRVSVYGPAIPIEDLRVVSVVCAGATPPRCSTILELSKPQAAALAATAPAGLRLVLQGGTRPLELGDVVIKTYR